MADREECAMDDPAPVESSPSATFPQGAAEPTEEVWSAEDVGAEYGSEALPDSGTDLFQSEPTDAPTRSATALPISKIKKIMKFDPDVTMANQEAVFLVSKATEMFIEALVKHAGTCLSHGKRKTVQKRDIESAADSVNNFAFLDGVLEAM